MVSRVNSHMEKGAFLFEKKEKKEKKCHPQRRHWTFMAGKNSLIFLNNAPLDSCVVAVGGGTGNSDRVRVCVCVCVCMCVCV